MHRAALVKVSMSMFCSKFRFKMSKNSNFEQNEFSNFVRLKVKSCEFSLPLSHRPSHPHTLTHTHTHPHTHTHIHTHTHTLSHPHRKRNNVTAIFSLSLSLLLKHNVFPLSKQKQHSLTHSLSLSLYPSSNFSKLSLCWIVLLFCLIPKLIAFEEKVTDQV